jgi:hypothetical protein
MGAQRLGRLAKTALKYRSNTLQRSKNAPKLQKLAHGPLPFSRARDTLGLIEIYARQATQQRLAPK